MISLAILSLLPLSLVAVFYALFAWDAIRYRAKRKAEAQSSSLHINYSYLLHWAKSAATSNPNLKLLDYGCGSGRVVAAARELGLNAYGADVYYGASMPYKDDAQRSGLLGDVIRQIRNGKLDFNDGDFDFVISNQVFEHVEGLEVVLGEIHRVMKNDTFFLSLFPSKEVIREGHIGIPFAHWFPKNSRLRYYYTLALREIGLGYVKGNKKSEKQWTEEALAWIDNYTVYRNKRDIVKAFSQFFKVSMIEDDYIKYRLSAREGPKLFARLLMLPLVPQISRALFRRLAGVVILAKKPGKLSE